MEQLLNCLQIDKLGTLDQQRIKIKIGQVIEAVKRRSKFSEFNIQILLIKRLKHE